MATTHSDAPQPQGSGLSILPDAGELRRSSLWLTSCCLERGVPAVQTGRLELCLNEVLANLIEHGCNDRRGTPVDLALQVSQNDGRGMATLTVIDDCPPFDPLQHRSGTPPPSLQAAEPGGLGLLLVKSFSDEVHYRRLEDRNELRMSVFWPTVE